MSCPIPKGCPLVSSWIVKYRKATLVSPSSSGRSLHQQASKARSLVGPHPGRRQQLCRSHTRRQGNGGDAVAPPSSSSAVDRCCLFFERVSRRCDPDTSRRRRRRVPLQGERGGRIIEARGAPLLCGQRAAGGSSVVEQQQQRQR